MKTYIVTAREKILTSCEVSAETKDEAAQKAVNLLKDALYSSGIDACMYALESLHIAIKEPKE